MTTARAFFVRNTLHNPKSSRRRNTAASGMFAFHTCEPLNSTLPFVERPPTYPMASIHEPDEVVDKEQVLKRLGDLYENGLQGQDDDEAVAAIFADSNLQKKLLFGSNGYDPNTVIPKILLYLRDKDAQQDVNWFVNFPIIRGYLAEAHRKMVTGELGFHDPKLRAALEDARVMVKVHLHSQSRFNENTPWTDDILRGQTTQQRLLTYPKVFPPPKPDRSKSQYRRVQPMPRPNDTSPLWKTTFQVIDPEAMLSHFAEIDNYVESENKFFEAVKKSVKTGKKEKQTSENDKFRMENEAYEHYMTQGLAETSNNPPSPPNDGPKGPLFYKRRGWQRAALQQCLNLFTNREHRVINTPWRRAVLPYDPPAPLPKEIAFVQRISEPSDGTDEKEKDPFAWLHWSFQYAQIVDFLATCQRRRYIYQSWSDFRAPALPINFRGPHISRGLTVHDQHWLKIGDYLENLETMLRGAWEAAPRPLLRAILRDIDAGRRDNTGGPNMDNSQYLPAEDDEDTLDRKRHWRRDIKRRLGIDNIKDNTEDDNYRLIDEYDVAWLRHLCEPSRTLEMCDSSKLPSRNLTTIFDAKLQSYFRDYAVSGAPDSTGLHIWAEDIDELDDVKRTYKPNTLREVLAYINGCKESELKASGDTDPNPEHPNACYQFSIEEAEFMCIELQNLGRCRYIPEYMREPARVGRPTYTVHPEDRITWRYADLQEFREQSAEYLEDMVNHYDISYGNWSLYNGNRPRFSRELEFILDHVGPDFRYELERVETQQKIAASHEAFGKRRAFIKDHLAPEGLCQLGHVESGGTESERDAPYREDLASWEAVGTYLTKLYKQNKEKDAATNRYFPNEPFHPQTPEKTVQFFRNLAYRAGRTLRHVNQIKNRLQYTESSSDAGIPLKPSLDLSADLKEPRPENGGDGAPAPTIVEKWWQAIPSKDYELAVEKWNTTIQGGTGELALLPPDIKEVLEKADPTSSSQHPLKENQDPFTIIREGIIDACFQNRPTVYPGRISAFKDQENKGFQGYERPSLFEWATKDQRRYQAPHTRRHFFNMQRWPASRILPQRLEAIQQRKDQGARIDPSKPDQAYGILTNRVPIGAEKPVYAHPLIHHGHGDRWNDFGEFGGFGDFGDWSYPDGDPDPPRLASDPSGGNNNANDIQVNTVTIDDNYNANDIQVNTVTIDDNYNANDIQVHTVILDDNYNAMGAKVQFQVPTAQAATTQMYEASTTTEVPNIEVPKMEAMAPELAEQIKLAEQAQQTKAKESVMRDNIRARKARRRALVPYTRSDEKFAPGPAVFPMGDTLLQKVMISNELNNGYPISGTAFLQESTIGSSKGVAEDHWRQYPTGPAGAASHEGEHPS
ncbi:hypothetical protein NUW58_g4918 [Xylaria curta]|uniref:Uncharacterized protein n=1 Tax=Xylaria curta TaxID=42375 RepID=A0ACC1P473_9PEZI|nr:hypothetical protein NUW58_g4918 [Xylaria curta]